MKVLTWNVNRAGQSRVETWKMLKREEADIVLLQEVKEIPTWVWDCYQCYSMRPRYFDGRHAPFSTAVLSRGAIDATPYLRSDLEWINKICTERYGWIVGCETALNSGERFRVISVHLPAFPVPRNLWADADISGIKLTNNPKVWFTEILYMLLRRAHISDDENWIVAGDFNTSVKFDYPKDRGNREFIGRLNALGLTDCLSHCQCGPVPTFQHSSKVIEHQLDYYFVNARMLMRLKRAQVRNRNVVFDQKPKLSDHLPVLCEFD